MSRDWRCLIGWHDWREVEMPDHDKCAECTRCGKRDWRRLLTHTSSKWRGGDPACLPDLKARRQQAGATTWARLRRWLPAGGRVTLSCRVVVGRRW
jgi:hypothetical protein